MFFDEDRLSVRILEVVALDEGSVEMSNLRGYHAISLRYEADTHLSFGNRTLHAGENTVGYFPANLRYRRRSSRDRMIVVHFELDNYYSGAIEMFRTERPEVLRPLFEEMYRCWQEQGAGYYYRTMGYFYQILALIREELGSAPLPDLPERIRPSMEYLNENFTDPNLTVAKLAECSRVSEVYFRKLFLRATGLSPRRYLLEKRISYALALLESRCFSVAEVAEQAGFADPKYFSTLFCKIVGSPPSRYQYKWEQKNAEDGGENTASNFLEKM